MQLSIAPNFIARKQATTQPAVETESAVASRGRKGNPSPLYALAVVVRIGVLGTLLFHALAFGPW